MMFLKSAFVALLALTSVSAKAFRKRDAFLKAMQGPPSAAKTLRGKSEARRQLYRNIVAKGRHVGGRQLNDQGDGFGFDVSQYSLKYTGCASIDTYSDEMAEQEDVTSVLAKQRFVTLRLCPSNSCNKYSVNGCGSDYSEILVDMYDYLEAVSRYTEEVQERYCQYCERCYEAEETSSNGRQLDGTQSSQPDFDADADCEDLCGDYYYNSSGCDMRDEDESGTQQQQEEEELDVSQFFMCSMYGEEDESSTSNTGSYWSDWEGDDNDYYISPICDSDGYSITFGVFGDEFCSTKVQNGKSFYAVTGLNISDFDLDAYTPQECVSCVESRDDWEFQEDSSSNGGGNQQQNEADEISEMCQQVWESGAKCNKNFKASQSSYNYMGWYENSAYQELVCDYIGMLVDGDYNEGGTITVDANLWQFNTSNWKNKTEYLKEGQVLYSAARSNVSTGRIFGLIVSSVAVFVMLIWACCLHGALLRTSGDWKPRRSKQTYTDPDSVSRQNSGIVLGRSLSEKENPLI